MLKRQTRELFAEWARKVHGMAEYSTHDTAEELGVTKQDVWEMEQRAGPENVEYICQLADTSKPHWLI